MTHVRVIIALLLCAPLALASCNRRVQPAVPTLPPPVAEDAPPPPPPPPPPPQPEPAAAAEAGLTEEDIFARKTLEELNAERPLGERRGHAVREYLISLGVEGDRLFVVSKGEESPVCFDEHESCWQQNRRAHPIITAK